MAPFTNVRHHFRRSVKGNVHPVVKHEREIEGATVSSTKIIAPQSFDGVRKGHNIGDQHWEDLSDEELDISDRLSKEQFMKQERLKSDEEYDIAKTALNSELERRQEVRNEKDRENERLFKEQFPD